MDLRTRRWRCRRRGWQGRKPAWATPAGWRLGAEMAPLGPGRQSPLCRGSTSTHSAGAQPGRPAPKPSVSGSFPAIHTAPRSLPSANCLSLVFRSPFASPQAGLQALALLIPLPPSDTGNFWPHSPLGRGSLPSFQS